MKKNSAGDGAKVLKWFFAFGMLTSFFDLLTAPLLTLGIPLLIVLYIELIESPNNVFVKKFADIVKSSCLWGLGYALNWINKWIIYSIAMRGKASFAEVIKENMDYIELRTNGMGVHTGFPVDRGFMFRANLSALFPNGRVQTAAVLLIFALIMILSVIFFRKKVKISNVALLSIVAVYPYAWFTVIANHSQYHSYFAFRIQAISVFAVLLICSYVIDWDKIKNLLTRFFIRKHS